MEILDSFLNMDSETTIHDGRLRGKRETAREEPGSKGSGETE